MIGIDTNVLVRYLVRDDERQFDAARRLIDRQEGANEPVLISLVVLAETEWVLRSRCGLNKAGIAAAFSALLDTADLMFEDEPTIEHALYTWNDSRADFHRLPYQRPPPTPRLPLHGDLRRQGLEA